MYRPPRTIETNTHVFFRGGPYAMFNKSAPFNGRTAYNGFLKRLQVSGIEPPYNDDHLSTRLLTKTTFTTLTQWQKACEAWFYDDDFEQPGITDVDRERLGDLLCDDTKSYADWPLTLLFHREKLEKRDLFRVLQGKPYSKVITTHSGWLCSSRGYKVGDQEDLVSVAAVTAGIVAKADASNTFKTRILETKDKCFVAANRDDEWGSGIDFTDVLKKPEDYDRPVLQWDMENRLGRCYNEAREELRTADSK